MLRFLTVGLVLSFSLNAHAVPQQLMQQGRLLDSSGAAMSGLHGITFRIYDSETGGSLLWEELLLENFQNGYFSTVLGANSFNPLTDAILQTPNLHLEIEVDNNGPLSPRKPLQATPYARLAQQATDLSGGVVNALEVSIDGSLVIDGNGSWVGPAIGMAWSDISGVPSDLLDGDNDTLAGLSCSVGQLAAWDGAMWACADDNGLTEAEVEAFVTNDPLDLAMGSMVGGDLIVTVGTDQDRLATLGLNCQNGDTPKWDQVLSDWVCGIDSVLDDASVDAYVENNALDLALGTTLGSQTVLTDQNCIEGEFIALQNGVWTCTSFTTLMDNDGDGVFAWDDCDDNDPNSFIKANDNDCDGIATADDCNDFDPNSNSIAIDGDCDGVLTADDCDDSDASYGSSVNDADCDGVLTADDCDDLDSSQGSSVSDADCDGIITPLDCDDFDASVGSNLNDADCDGVPASSDCDDNDPSVTGGVGLSSNCAAESCLDIVNQTGTSTDGTYWITAGNTMTPFPVVCNMSHDGGGWTRCIEFGNTSGEDVSGNSWFDSCVDYTSAGWTGNDVMIEIKNTSSQVIYAESGSRSSTWTYDQMTSTNSASNQYYSDNHDYMVSLTNGDKMMVAGQNSDNNGCGGSFGNGYGITVYPSNPNYHSNPKLMVMPYRHQNGSSAGQPRYFSGWTAENEITFDNGNSFDTCNVSPAQQGYFAFYVR